jgi:glycerate kinase
MRVVIATDTFKDCMSAARACNVIATTLAESEASFETQCFPLADGGEGTLDAFRAVQGGQWIDCSVTGPLPERQVKAGFLWMPDTRTALVEMAQASGLEHLKPEERNPLKTTTYGTGELLCAARDLGAEKILLAVGGSATVDLGIGCAAAVGWGFLDKADQPVEPVGQNLLKIHKLVPPERAWDIPIEVLCDVSNPLLGVHGAARVFGPQKGADRADVVLLEVGLTHMVQRIIIDIHMDIGGGAGGGAAGGLAAGAAAFLQAQLASGVDFVLEQTGARQALSQADWVITGEGSLDEQSLEGKVVSGVVAVCREQKIPVTVFAGRVALAEGKMHEAGIHEAIAITPPEVAHEQALREGPKWLSAAVLRWAGEHLDVG